MTGLYFYDRSVAALARTLLPSVRGELEITDLNRVYMDRRKLHVAVLGRGTARFDTGTQSSLLDASNFVEAIEERQLLKICCPEEIAYHMGHISAEELERITAPLAQSGYGAYLLEVPREGERYAGFTAAR